MPRRRWGGWGTISGVWWGTPRLHFTPFLFWFFVLDRTTRTAPAESGEDGSDPPFLTAGAVSRWGGCGTRWGTGWGTPTPPPPGGVAPVRIYPCGKAPRPARGPDDRPHRAARCLTHSYAPSWSSAPSAPRAPERGRACFPRADPMAVLVRYHTPNYYAAVVAWYYVAARRGRVPHAGQFLISTSRIWFARMGVSLGLRSRLPAWPLSPTADGPAIVVGEVHHPVRAIESPTPEWLMIPERGLSTGVAIFGAVGSGKTSACMHPVARQLLGWALSSCRRARVFLLGAERPSLGQQAHVTSSH